MLNELRIVLEELIISNKEIDSDNLIKFNGKSYTIDECNNIIKCYIDNINKLNFDDVHNYISLCYQMTDKISFNLLFFIIQKFGKSLDLLIYPWNHYHILISITETKHFSIDNYTKLYRHLKNNNFLTEPEVVISNYFFLQIPKMNLIARLIKYCCNEKIFSIIKFILSEEKTIIRLKHPIYEIYEKFLFVNYDFHYKYRENEKYWYLKVIELLLELNLFDVEQEFVVNL